MRLESGYSGIAARRGSTVDVRLSGGGTARVHSVGQGKPIVLLHGWSMHAALFNPIIPALAESHRLISYDLRGHGPVGTRADAGAMTVEQCARDLGDVLDALALWDVTCVGWSMGAMVMWSAALDRTIAPRLSGLVSIDMSPRVTNDSTWALGLRDGRTAVQTLAAIDIMHEDWPRMVQRCAERIFAEGATGDHLDAVITTMRERAMTFDPERMAELWASMTIQDFRDALRSLSIPQLAIHGAQSQLYDVAVGADLQTRMPRCESVIFENAGHTPHLEDKDRFVTTLAGFVQRTADGRRTYAQSQSIH